MKQLFLIFGLLIVLGAGAQTYSPAAHTVTNKALGLAQATPTDARSFFYDASLFIYRPYQSTAEVLTYLNIAKYRTGNFSIFINSGTLQTGGTFTGGVISEYWFKNGVADSNLVLKSNPVTMSAVPGLIDTLATKANIGDVYSNTITFSNVASLQAYTGTASTVFVTDSLQGGTFKYDGGLSTFDGGINIQSTSRSGGYTRQYNRALAVDMSWYGFRYSNTATQNKAIVNAYISANPNANISFPSSALPIDSITVTNNLTIWDKSKQGFINGGQYFGKSAAGGGYHLSVIGVKESIAARIYLEPLIEPTVQDQVTAKADIFGNAYTALNNTTNYRVATLDFINDYSNGTNGIYGTFVKGVGNHFGKAPALHFGFNDNSVVPLKIVYYDYSDSGWRVPYKGAWFTSLVISEGDYISASNHLYRAVSTGTTGATVPSHTTGTANDGGVDWLFIRDYSGATSAHFQPCIIIGNKTSLPIYGLDEGIRMQMFGGVAFVNSMKNYFLDNTNKVAWTTGVDLNTDAYKIADSTGTHYLRFSKSGHFVQNVGLSWLPNAKIISDNSATPSLDGGEHFIFANSSVTSITNFIGSSYQRFTLIGGNGNTTLVNSANIQLAGGVNVTLGTGAVLSFVMNSAGTVATQVQSQSTASTTGNIIPSVNVSSTVGDATHNYLSVNTVLLKSNSSLSITSTGAQPIAFNVNGTEAFRVDATTNVNLNTTTNVTSAQLQVASTTKGVLIPKMTKAQRDAIVSPAQGLLVFVTDGTAYLSWYNSGWQKVSSISDP